MGAYCRENDSTVFVTLEKAFSYGDLNIPPMRNIPGTTISFTLLVGRDEAFFLKPNLMRPFQGEISISQKPYSVANFLAQGEQLNALFGFLTKNFGIFRNFGTSVEVTVVSNQ